jgi:DNA-binding GntR family transcriptional regulator
MIDVPAPLMNRIERPRSLTEIVIEQIRDLIVSGRLKLGEQLSESTLALQLGVSRTPVREAFLRLESERLVEVRPQRGTFVFEFDAGKLGELCELREVLETGALRVGLTRDRRRYVDRLAAEVAAAAEAGLIDPVAYQPFDTAFHEAVVSGSSNAELIEAYGRISGRIRTIRFQLAGGRKQIEGSQRDHAEIVQLLQAGGDEAAMRCLAAHVYNGYQLYLRHLDAAKSTGRVKRRLPKGR